MRCPPWIGYDFFFLTVGLPHIRKRDGGPKEWVLLEPEGVRLSRRNIIALSALLILAGFAYPNPSDLKVFGLELGTGTRGTIILTCTVFVVQAYWYGLKYLHIRESGEIDGPHVSQNKRPLSSISDVCIKQKSANWIANCVAAGLTVASWGVLAYWLMEAFSPSHAT